MDGNKSRNTIELNKIESACIIMIRKKKFENESFEKFFSSYSDFVIIMACSYDACSNCC